KIGSPLQETMRTSTRLLLIALEARASGEDRTSPRLTCAITRQLRSAAAVLVSLSAAYKTRASDRERRRRFSNLASMTRRSCSAGSVTGKGTPPSPLLQRLFCHA